MTGATLAVSLYLNWEWYRRFLESPLPLQVDFRQRQIRWKGKTKVVW